VTRAIVHIDMDAFYASVEQRDNPKLRGQPVIVGGDPQRGVVLAASYEVRPSGVRSAIPMARALKLAPHAVVVAPRFEAYVEASESIFRIFERYTPLVEALSLDEAFLDLTDSQSLFGPASGVAQRIRSEIRSEVGLAASAGVAEVKFVAKIASDFAKPNGVHVVPLGGAQGFLSPLPIARLWGVGPKTEETLRRLGFHTIGDVAKFELEALVRKLGEAGQHYWELSRGIDTRPVVPDRAARSVGAQDTFPEDLTGEDAMRPFLHSQALRVGRRLRKCGVKSRCVQLTVKFSDFTQITRSMTLSQPIDDGQELYRLALELLRKVDLRRSIRLTGISAQELEHPGTTQLTLFDAKPQPRHAQLNRTLDAIAAKFGTQAVVTADLQNRDVFQQRDGFYGENKRETADAAEKQRQSIGPIVVRDEEPS
jgi:DNA polymerase-4